MKKMKGYYPMKSKVVAIKKFGGNVPKITNGSQKLKVELLAVGVVKNVERLCALSLS